MNNEWVFFPHHTDLAERHLRFRLKLVHVDCINDKKGPYFFSSLIHIDFRPAKFLNFQVDQFLVIAILCLNPRNLHEMVWFILQIVIKFLFPDTLNCLYSESLCYVNSENREPEVVIRQKPVNHQYIYSWRKSKYIIIHFANICYLKVLQWRRDNTHFVSNKNFWHWTITGFC